MSTTFQVFPTHMDYPTYGRVRDLSLVRLNEFLARHGASRSIESIRIVWRDGTDDPAEVDYDVIWEKDSHPRMWFYIGSDIVGGATRTASHRTVQPLRSTSLAILPSSCRSGRLRPMPVKGATGHCSGPRSATALPSSPSSS